MPASFPAAARRGMPGHRVDRHAGDSQRVHAEVIARIETFPLRIPFRAVPQAPASAPAPALTSCAPLRPPRRRTFPVVHHPA